MHQLNRVCIEKDHIYNIKVVVKDDSSKWFKVKIILFKHQVLWLSHEEGHYATNGMSISNIDRGFEAIYKTYTDSSYNNIIIKETNDEPKNQLILNKIYTVPYGTDIWKKNTQLRDSLHLIIDMRTEVL